MHAPPPQRVLLVDDDPAFAGLISELLTDARPGVEIDLERAGSLAEGLTALDRQSHDCVLLDLGLPDAAPEDALRQITLAAGATAVIVVSANGDPDLPARARRTGALEFLSKDDLDGPRLARLLDHATLRSHEHDPAPADVPRPGPALAAMPLAGATIAALIGALGVIGWSTDSAVLLTWGIAVPTIKLLSAIALLALAAAITLLHQPTPRRRRIALVLCALVGGWSLLVLAEWCSGRSLGFDQLLATDPATSGVPGRPSPHTVIALLMAAGALAALDARSAAARLMPRIFGFCFFATVTLAVIGWMFGSDALTGRSQITGMSLPTLAGLIALLAGYVTLRPASVPLVWIARESPAGTLVRRLIPVGLIAPPLLGGLLLLGEQAHAYDTRLGLAMFATSMVAVFIVGALTTARSVERRDQDRRAIARTLAVSESRFRSLSTLSPVGVIETDLEGDCTYVNPAWCEMSSVSPSAAWGTGWTGTVHASDRKRVLSDWRTDVGRDEDFDLEYRSARVDGGERLIRTRRTTLRNAQGAITGYLGAATDITAQREAQAEQAALRRVATAVAEDAGGDAILHLIAKEVGLLLDSQTGAVVRFDSQDAGTVIGMWTADGTVMADRHVALDGSNAVSVVARTGHAARIERYEPAAGASTEAIRRLALSGGVAAPITIAGRLWGAVAAGLSDAAGFSADAEQRLERFAELAATAISNVQAREALIELATTDAITGLPNYRSFHEHLQAEAKRALRYGRQMSVVLLDLDKFKQINDTHGHHTGDAVLAETARRLRTQVRKGEVIARIGGEEFAWLLPETDAIGAHAAAERVRHAIAAEPFDRAGAVTLSAGVCSLADSGDAAAMMRLADRALYAAKDAGRNATRRHPLDERTQSADALIEASIT